MVITLGLSKYDPPIRKIRTPELFLSTRSRNWYFLGVLTLYEFANVAVDSLEEKLLSLRFSLNVSEFPDPETCGDEFLL